MMSFSYSKSGRKQHTNDKRGVLKDSSSITFIPLEDTGEAAGFLHLTSHYLWGGSGSFFEKDGKDRFGLKEKQPNKLRDLRVFPLDALEETGSGGDICIQACADDLQVAFHAVRNLARIARGKRFITGHRLVFNYKASKPKNAKKFIGFKDGTLIQM